jgi:DNA-binding GntR family transcriptional regulator
MDDPRPRAVVIRAVNARIADGTWPPGTRVHLGLLGDELGIGADTVRKAMGELEEQGIVRRWPGLGWYVTGDGSDNEEAPG